MQIYKYTYAYVQVYVRRCLYTIYANIQIYLHMYVYVCIRHAKSYVQVNVCIWCSQMCAYGVHKCVYMVYTTIHMYTCTKKYLNVQIYLHTCMHTECREVISRL